MDAELVKRLLDLNQTFYSEFSTVFSDSRSSERLNLGPFRQHVTNGIRILDVGCGNGRLAHALDRSGLALDYVGIDGSRELIALATAHSTQLVHVRTLWRVADLASPGWSDPLDGLGPFDLAMALAVLHHLPGVELRVNLLQQIRRLLRPDARLVLSSWQFLRSERLRRKTVPWETLALDASSVEDGDYLLDWKRGGVGYRYVHLLTEQEVGALAQASGLTVVEQFYADQDLNLYSILQAPGEES